MNRSPLRRGLAAASMLALAAVGLSACGDDSNASGGGSGEKVLRVVNTTTSECNDPQLDNYGFGSSVGRQIVDSLVERDPKDPTDIKPWLASSWEVSPDAKTYTFHLRDDVTFSNGEELTAQVVKDNFETLAGLTGTGSAFVQGIASIDTPDDYTVVINFENPNAPFLQAAAQYQLGIVAPETLAKSAEERCAEGVIGSGPFVTDSFTLKENWNLVKRKDYNWASDARAHQGEAYLDRIEFTFIEEASVRTGALTSGQVELTAVTHQDVETIEAAGLQTFASPNRVPAVGLQVNTSRGVLKDQAVREALRHAIDREDVVEKAHAGLTEPATGSLTAASPFHIDQSDLLTHDIPKSISLLEGAGWTEVKDGIRYKDGQPLTITVTYASSPENTRFLEVIQANVREAGIDFQLRPLTSGEFDEALLAGDYDVHRWSGALIDGDVLRTLYSATTLNKAQLPPDNDLEPLFQAELAEADPVKRKAIIDEIQEIVVSRGYQIPVFDMVTYYGGAKNVSGVEFDDSAIWLYDVDLKS